MWNASGLDIFEMFIILSSIPYGEWRKNLDRLNKGHYIKVSKYVDDIKGYYPYIKELKSKVFRFKKKDIDNATHILAQYHPENHTMVSIHIRLTDFKSHLSKLFHIENYMSNGYFKRAMNYFVDKYKVSEIF